MTYSFVQIDANGRYVYNYEGIGRVGFIASSLEEANQKAENELPNLQQELERKPLEEARKIKQKALNTWLNRPYVDSVKGWTIDISRESRSTLHQYENKQRKKLAKGDITDTTPNDLITLSHGLQSVTLEELEDLNIRIGDDVEARTIGEITTKAAIAAATTPAEVEAIPIPVPRPGAGS